MNFLSTNLAFFCYALIVIGLFQVPCNIKKERKVEKKIMTETNVIKKESDAVIQASKLTGLDALTTKITAERLTLQDDRTPYLWNKYNGQMAWKVEFAEVSLKFKTSMPDFADSYTRKFVVHLDEKTGQLISVVTRFEGKDPDLREQPLGVTAENQLRAEEEFYYGLPTKEPKLTFLGALEVVLNKGIGSPFVAKEIYANYVMHSRGGSPQRAVWVITLRGIPPLPARGEYGDQIPVWQRNHIRNVVDDETGVNLFATNSPQPE